MAADAVRHGIEFWDLKKTYAYRMDPMDSVDIDSELDFMLAETILRQRGYA
jgi:CMP-N-acetylneuraminic acid synthetase